MSFPQVIGGRFHVPHVICVRDAAALDDASVLKALGLEAYRRRAPWRRPDRYASVGLARASGWTVVADDWSYELFHEETTDRRVEKLARCFDVLRVITGDCDMSFEVYYYRAGDLARRLVVKSPRYDDQVVEVNDGRPLAGETELFAGKLSPWWVVSGMGIETRPGRLRFARWWAPEPNQRWQ